MKTPKSLVLAPAVAAAVSGLIAVPAFASPAPTPSESSESIELPDHIATAGPATVNPSASSDTSTSAPSEEADPEAIVETSQVSQKDIADEKVGIRFSGTGFTEEGKATVTVVGTDGTEYTPKSELTVTEEGEVNGRYFFTTTKNAKVPVGTYNLYLTDLESKTKTETVKFAVVEKVDETTPPTETAEPTESATPTATAEPTQTATPTQTAEPTATPEATPTETTAPTPSATPTEEPTKSEEPTEAAEPTQTATPTPTATSTETAEPTPTATSTATETATGDPDAVFEPKISIDPTEITSDEFSASDGGVAITVADAEPGSQVALTVSHGQGQVSRFETSKAVNNEGNAVFELHPDGKSVLGAYSVVVTGEGFDDLTGSFTVVTNGTEVERDDDNSQGGSDDSDDKGSGDKGSGNDGSGNDGSGDARSGGSSDDSRSGNAADLPRTGTELTGLALGAGLLVVGAAAVVITRRRAAQADPAEF